MELIVTRPSTAFGHTDKVELVVTLKSSRPKPLKLRAFEVTLQEILTLRPPPARGAKQTAINRARPVYDFKSPISEMISRGQEISRAMGFTCPHQGMMITVKGGKAIDVAYELQVKAIMEGTGDVKVEHLQCTVGLYPRPRAMHVVRWERGTAWSARMLLILNTPQPNRLCAAAVPPVASAIVSSLGLDLGTIIHRTGWPVLHDTNDTVAAGARQRSPGQQRPQQRFEGLFAQQPRLDAILPGRSTRAASTSRWWRAALHLAAHLGRFLLVVLGEPLPRRPVTTTGQVRWWPVWCKQPASAVLDDFVQRSKPAK